MPLKNHSPLSVVSLCLALAAPAAFALPSNSAADATNLIPEEQVFQTSLTAVDLASVDFNGALETEAFKVGFEPHLLASADIEAALEQEVFKVALDVASPEVLARMQAREDKMFEAALEPQILASADIESALEYEVLKVAVAPIVVQPTSIYDDVFAVSLVPRSLQSLNVPEELQTAAFIANRDSEAVLIQATLDVDAATKAAGSSRAALPVELD